MRKYLSQLAVYIVLLALLAGCAPVVEQPAAGPIVLSDELLSLMETVNREHQAVVKPEIDEAAVVQRWARDTSKYALDYQIAGSMSDDGVLTAQQAKNDVNVLFYNLQTRYGLYGYFGGDEVFEPARQATLQACDEAGSLTPDELADILIANLAFVKDGHFSVGNQLVAEMIFPFHYRDVDFERTDAGYQTVTEKKRVISIDGYEDLDSLFRRSISDDGAIVYYPVVLVGYSRRDLINRGFTPAVLTVNYEDGTAQHLAIGRQNSSVNREKNNVELYESQSIPVLFSGKMGFDEAGDQDAQAFLAYAEQLKNEPVMILDLRSNRGGNGALPYKWLQAYTGENVAGNCYSVKLATMVAESSRPGPSSYISPETLTDLLGMKGIGSGLTLSAGQSDVFIENDNLLVVLTGKGTASAAEGFIDLLYNVRNVLFIGESTAGYFLGDGAHFGYKLPCSQISVDFGDILRIFPDGDYFQEMRGFLPDLWVPAGDAEELAIKLILNNK